jgi:hypothetical protein
MTATPSIHPSVQRYRRLFSAAVNRNIRFAATAVFVSRVLSAQIDVLTAQYGNARTSTNMQEQVLTTANVNAGQSARCSAEMWMAPFTRRPCW